MDEKEKSIRIKLRDDFEHYAKTCLKIHAKDGSLIHLILNKAQRYIHQQIEGQRKETGKVRVIILKGRQEGCSTYVQARCRWIITHRPGTRAFILTHRKDATENLFEMAQRFQQHCPSLVCPKEGSNNAKELHFPLLNSGYQIGTAGSKTVGRSFAFQFFHGSEVAFWPNAAEHAKGILQTIHRGKGSEIILESTANGVDNYFHEQWQQAERGVSEFLPIFVPWFWDEGYKEEIKGELALSEEEIKIRDIYHLSNEQMLWRRKKIIELSTSGMDGEKAFKQEYPSNAEEAFQTSGEDRYIDSHCVMAARKQNLSPYGVKYLGVDPARYGDDRTSIIFRQGRVAYGLKSYTKLDTMQVTGIVHQLIKQEKPDFVLIDIGNMGAGIVDRLHELGFQEIVKGINSASRSLNKDRYPNKRHEMWGEMKQWLEEGDVQIPDSNSLHADLCALTYYYNSNGELRLEHKDDMKSRGAKSPDEADALALTFSFPYRPNDATINRIINPSIRLFNG